MPQIVHCGKARRVRTKSKSDTMACWLSLSCDNLRRYLEDDEDSVDSVPDGCSILILDCRTFLAYNKSHIMGSVNAHCPAILRRRFGEHLPLRTIIPSSDIRDQLLAGAFSPVVLYEDSHTQEDSMANFVARCLQIQAGLRNIYLLTGGFQEFHLQYPHLCGSTPSTAPASSTPPGSRSPLGFWTLNALSRSSSSPALCSYSCLEQEQEPVEILPYLYLGNEYHASSKDTLQKLGITALLNVSHSCPNYFEDSFEYMSIPIEDSNNEDISVWFRKANEYIDNARESHGKVLVHCFAGISRSATICMAYIMATKKLRMEEAYEYVKLRRKIISPNFSFMGQLLSFESQVFPPSRRCSKSGGSPRSPLVALIANTPIAESPVKPSTSSPSPHHSRSGSSFDFAISSSALASLVRQDVTPRLGRPLCVTSILSPT